MRRIERVYSNGLLAKEVEYHVVHQPQVTATGIVVKEGLEDRFLLTVAYPAWKADPSMAADGHRDFASDEVIEKAAWRFMLKGAKLGMWHQDGQDHCATVVESYIYRGPDWMQDDGQVVCKGDWLLGTILQPETWSLYKAGLIGGMSPQGAASRGEPSAETLARLRS